MDNCTKKINKLPLEDIIFYKKYIDYLKKYEEYRNGKMEAKIRDEVAKELLEEKKQKVDKN